MLRRALLVVALCSVGGSVSAQSFFNKLMSSDVVNTVVSTVAGGSAVSVANIKGTWSYTQPAVELVGDDVLSDVAGSLATSSIETKLSESLTRVGIVPGAFTFVFGEDGTFSCALKGRSIGGTYTLDQDRVVLKFSAAGMVKLGTMNAEVSLTGGSLSLLFSADKLLALVDTLSSLSSNTTLQTLNSLLSSYDGVMVGFQMSK